MAGTEDTVTIMVGAAAINAGAPAGTAATIGTGTAITGGGTIEAGIGVITAAIAGTVTTAVTTTAGVIAEDGWGGRASTEP